MWRISESPASGAQWQRAWRADQISAALAVSGETPMLVVPFSGSLQIFSWLQLSGDWDFFLFLLTSLTSHIMYCHLRGAWSSFVPFDLKKPNAHIHNINYLYFLHHDLIPVHALFSFAGSPSPPRPPVQRCSLSPCPPWNQYRLMDSLRNNETWIHWETTHYYYLCYIQLWVKWALGLAQESYQHLCYFHEKRKAFQILTKSAKALF